MKSIVRLPRRRHPFWKQWKRDRLPFLETRPLDVPFFVLATQNPIELEGTYPLPEAQLDRFLLNPVIDYLSEEDEIKMVGETTGVQGQEAQAVLTGEDIFATTEPYPADPRS